MKNLKFGQNGRFRRRSFEIVGYSCRLVDRMTQITILTYVVKHWQGDTDICCACHEHCMRLVFGLEYMKCNWTFRNKLYHVCCCFCCRRRGGDDTSAVSSWPMLSQWPPTSFTNYWQNLYSYWCVVLSLTPPVVALPWEQISETIYRSIIFVYAFPKRTIHLYICYNQSSHFVYSRFTWCCNQ